jgi:DNA-binding winged helix-turn-helix (wHTH) protein
VPLTPKTYDTLLVLVENNGRMLSKTELMKAMWPDSFVEESNLSVQISIVRKALGDAAGEHRYIVTVPGLGYRFGAQVRGWSKDETDVIEDHSRAEILIEEVEEENPLEVNPAIPVDSPAPSPPRAPMAFPKLVLLLAGALALLTAFLFVALRSPTVPPHVLRYAQLTTSGVLTRYRKSSPMELEFILWRALPALRS